MTHKDTRGEGVRSVCEQEIRWRADSSKKRAHDLLVSYRVFDSVTVVCVRSMLKTKG